MKLNGNLSFHTLGDGEIKNAILERVTTAVRLAAAHSDGRMVYDLDLDAYFYSANGAWVQMASGGDATALLEEINAIEASLGTELVTGAGIFNSVDANLLANVSGATDLYDVLQDLDAAISTASGVDTLNELTDTTISGTGTPAATSFLRTVGASGSWTDHVLVTGDVTDLTATAAEINILDGVTGVTAAELTFVGGLTSDAQTQLNDGVTSDGQIRTFIGQGAGADATAYTNNNYITDGVSLEGSIDALDGALSTVAGDLSNHTHVLGDLTNVDDLAAKTADLAVMFMGDGTNLDTVTLVAGSDISSVSASGVSVTLNVDDSFLRNTGDNLTTGTLTVDSGASIVIATGGDITAADAPVSANDLTNKAYVDALVSAGASWKNPLVDSDLVDVVAVVPATPEATYGLVTGDNVTFITTAAITFALGAGTTVVGTGAGDIVNLTITSAGNGDYTLVETPLAAGDRFIISAEHGTIGATLSAIDVNSDGFTLANGDLIQFTGTGDGSTAASWNTPDGRSGNAGGGTEIDQGVTVLNSDPESVHYGHTYMYNAADNNWVEISGPGSIGAGDGLSYTGSTLNIGMGAGVIALPADEVGVDVRTDGGLITTLDGSTIDTTAAAQLGILLDGTTLALSVAGIEVADGGITNTQVNGSAAIDYSKLATLASANILVGSAGGVATSVAMSGDVFIDNLGATTIQAGSVDNAMMANDSFTLNGDSGTPEDMALGEAVSVLGGTGMSTVVSATNTITVNGDDATTSAKGIASFNADQFSVTAGAVSLAATLDDLTNVTGADAATDGQIMVMGGASSFVAQSVYFLYTGGSATSHTITHSLGQKYCNVTVVDASDEVIIPQSITFTDANTTTVVFNTAIACTVIVMGVA